MNDTLSYKHTLKTFLFPIALPLFILFQTGCFPEAGTTVPIRQSRPLMGTIVEITVVAEEGKKTSDNLKAAFREIERLDNLIGTHKQRGELWSLNNLAFPNGANLSDEVFQLIKRARTLGDETGGAFDCTVGSLMRLWSFDTGGIVPEPQQIAAALPLIGWDKMILDDQKNRITFTMDGVILDLGGIGKGYAVDSAYNILASRGIRGGIINAGGDLRVWGRKPQKNGIWRIGIQHPRRPDDLLGIIEITDKAVVTSGDYENNFIYQGKMYHHIIDPLNGYPAKGIQSVTIVADNVEKADAYATALMVMGPEAARGFLSRHPDIEGIVVVDQDDIFVSEGLRDVFTRSE